MALRMKNVDILGLTERSDFQQGVHRKPIEREGLPKKGGLDTLPIKEGGACKKESWDVFEGGVNTPMYTMLLENTKRWNSRELCLPENDLKTYTIANSAK